MQAEDVALGVGEPGALLMRARGHVVLRLQARQVVVLELDPACLQFLHLAGQVGDVPGKPGAVPGGIEAETRQMLENVGRLLRMAGLDYPDVVKCTVYLRNFSDFAAMNAVYREYFPVEPPTRATVGVTALAEDFRVEIEVMATR